MVVRIGSNISSLQAQRRLSESSNLLSKTYEHLSTGQRINRASDDAAGLAIAESLKTKSRVFTQGVRNVNDSISFYSIAQGASEQLKNIVMRGKELAEQSANGTYSDTQRLALDSELQSLGQEYNRILNGTEFNGRKIFSKDQSSLNTQAGNSVLSTSLQSSRESQIDQIKKISVAPDGSELEGESQSNSNAALSADGRYAVFGSQAELVQGAGSDQIYRRDMQTGELKVVTTNSQGEAANDPSDEASISADGRYVLFHSRATNLAEGTVGWQVYRKDLETGEVQLAGSASDGTAADTDTDYGALSADGRYAVFQSVATNLVPGASAEQIYRKDFQTGQIQVVSASGAGAVSTGGCSDAAISSDGRYVVFGSGATNLIGGAAAGQIYRKDMLTGQIQFVSTSQTGTQGGGNLADISSDGRYVAFESSSSH